MLPPELGSRIHTAEFWREYLFVDEDAPWRPWNVIFPLGARGPALHLSAEASGYLSLGLSVEGTTVEVAWDDLAHWHPHLLRWAELDAVSRRVATEAPEYPHPGIALLLLARFAPLATAEDANMALPLLSAAWNNAGVQSPESRARLLQVLDFREARVRWRDVPSLGWCLEQDAQGDGPWLYSLRVQSNSEFPWRAWRDFTAQLEEGRPNGAGARRHARR